jgi:hypothetical protein
MFAAFWNGLSFSGKVFLLSSLEFGKDGSSKLGLVPRDALGLVLGDNRRSFPLLFGLNSNSSPTENIRGYVFLSVQVSI